MDKKIKDEIEKNSEQLNNLSAESNPARDFLEFIVDLIKTGAVVFVIAFALRYFVVQPYIVDGESMLPNFHNREYLLAEKVSYSIDKPQAGDVIIFQYPKNPSLNYIKRIIGLPGDTVKIADNKITIVNAKHPSGAILTEDYIPKDFLTETPTNGPYEITLKESEYFVLGDNRKHSSDSREWGPLPESNILGRAWVTLIPLDSAAFHKHINYPELSSSVRNFVAKLGR